MVILYAADRGELTASCGAFAQHMEPVLQLLQEAASRGHEVAGSRLASDYLQVCRWPFRQLEYSFAFDAIKRLTSLRGTALDAGAGVTPLPHALAGLGYTVHACDFDRGLMTRMAATSMADVYGTQVSYSWQDLSEIGFPDATFDLVTCISVLEHIPPPHDRRALRELLRVLKPGGLFVLTLDFQPQSATSTAQRYGRRAFKLARQGEFAELASAVWRKVVAAKAVAGGESAHVRSANECFEARHIKDDVSTELQSGDTSFRTSYCRSIDDVGDDDVEPFWNLVPGLFELQQRRKVLPAAVALVKRR